jgi:hypothetical protein
MILLQRPCQSSGCYLNLNRSLGSELASWAAEQGGWLEGRNGVGVMMIVLNFFCYFLLRSVAYIYYYKLGC